MRASKDEADSPRASEAVPDPVGVDGPMDGPFRCEVTPPGSKSLTNRALLVAALASGRSTIRNALVEADDASRMIGALRRLGARVDIEPRRVVVEGVGGRWRPGPGEVELDLGNAGTAVRFLAAGALVSPAPVVITGDARMRERPIGELAALLTRLGARVEFLSRDGCPPLRITPPMAGPVGGGTGSVGADLEVGTTASSQFISALLLVSPWLPGGLTLRLRGEVTSASYVTMTLALLDRLGAGVRMSEDLRVLRVRGARGESGGLCGFDYEVEPDASGATYFWAAAALVPGARCVVRGLDADSMQGDVGFVDVLQRMGAGVERGSGEAGEPGWIACRGPERDIGEAAELAPVNADLSSMPDAAMTLAVCASFARGRSVIRGLRTLRVKETDRIEALRVELAKIGVVVRAEDEGTISITPPIGCHAGDPGGARAEPPVGFDTYKDHRMAMSLALVGLRRGNVWIRDPGCVRKTYPAFWRDFSRIVRLRDGRGEWSP